MKRTIDFEKVNPIDFNMKVKDYLDRMSTSASDMDGKYYVFEVSDYAYACGYVKRTEVLSYGIVSVVGDFVYVEIHDSRILAEECGEVTREMKRRAIAVSEEFCTNMKKRLKQITNIAELSKKKGNVTNWNRIQESDVKTIFDEDELNPDETLNEAYNRLIKAHNGMLKYVGKMLLNVNNGAHCYVTGETVAGVRAIEMSWVKNKEIVLTDTEYHVMLGTCVELEGIKPADFIRERGVVRKLIRMMYTDMANASRKDYY